MTGPPTASELKWFGVILFVVFSAVGGVIGWRLDSPPFAQTAAGIGLALAAIYYAVRPLRLPMLLSWTAATAPIGRFVSIVLLAVTYYGVLTPIGLVMRLFGRDRLKRRFEPEADSYWTARIQDDTKHAGPRRYFRQS